MSRTQVFVYGTLKRGGSNHAYLRGQHYLGEACTEPRYALHDLGGYPGMVETEHEPKAIRGEVWEVNADCLAQLDLLESTAEGEYERVLVPLQGSQWQGVQGYLYRWPVSAAPRLGAVW